MKYRIVMLDVKVRNVCQRLGRDAEFVLNHAALPDFWEREFHHGDVVGNLLLEYILFRHLGLDHFTIDKVVGVGVYPGYPLWCIGGSDISYLNISKVQCFFFEYLDPDIDIIDQLEFAGIIDVADVVEVHGAGFWILWVGRH